MFLSSPPFPHDAERMGKANLNRGADTLIHAVAQRRVTETSASAKCVWPDGTASSAHQAGFWFYVQSMKGHDAACQRHTKEGQGQEFLHCVSPFKDSHATRHGSTSF